MTTPTTRPEPAKGDRVTFHAREYGPGDPIEGRPVTLHGTVIRPVWGTARNVSIKADDGRRFCRLAAAVHPEPAEPDADDAIRAALARTFGPAIEITDQMVAAVSASLDGADLDILDDAPEPYDL